MIEKTLQV